MSVLLKVKEAVEFESETADSVLTESSTKNVFDSAAADVESSTTEIGIPPKDKFESEMNVQYLKWSRLEVMPSIALTKMSQSPLKPKSY